MRLTCVVLSSLCLALVRSHAVPVTGQNIRNSHDEGHPVKSSSVVGHVSEPGLGHGIHIKPIIPGQHPQNRPMQTSSRSVQPSDKRTGSPPSASTKSTVAPTHHSTPSSTPRPSHSATTGPVPVLKSSSAPVNTPNNDSPRVSHTTIIIAVVVPVVAILLLAGIIYYTYRRSRDVKTPMSPYSRSFYYKTFCGYEGGGMMGGAQSVRSSTISRAYGNNGSRALRGANPSKVWPVTMPYSPASRRSRQSGMSRGSYTWYPATPSSRSAAPTPPPKQTKIGHPQRVKQMHENRRPVNVPDVPNVPDIPGQMIYTNTTPVMAQNPSASSYIINPADYRMSNQSASETAYSPPMSNAPTAINPPSRTPTNPTQTPRVHYELPTPHPKNESRISDIDMAQPFVPPSGFYSQFMPHPARSTPNLSAGNAFTVDPCVVNGPNSAQSHPMAQSQPSLSATEQADGTTEENPNARQVPGRTNRPSSSMYSVVIPARNPSRIAQSGLSIQTRSTGAGQKPLPLTNSESNPI